MNTKQQIAQQRANLAMAEFLKELFTPPYVISESTFDETKESVELFANDVARKFKVAMKQSGKIV